MKTLLFLLSYAFASDVVICGDSHPAGQPGQGVLDSHSNLYIGTLRNDSELKLSSSPSSSDAPSSASSSSRAKDAPAFDSPNDEGEEDETNRSSSRRGEEVNGEADNLDQDDDQRSPEDIESSRSAKNANYTSNQIYIGIVGIAPAALGALCFWLSKCRRRVFFCCPNAGASKASASSATDDFTVVTTAAGAVDNQNYHHHHRRKSSQNQSNQHRNQLNRVGISYKQLEKLRHLAGSAERLQPSAPSRPPSSKQRKSYSIEVSRRMLTLADVLGEGNFGQVWKAKLVSNDGQQPVTVAVKTNKLASGDQEASELLEELDIMVKLHSSKTDAADQLAGHPNVVRLLGCCTLTAPYYLLLEYCQKGKLQSALRDLRPKNNYYNDSSDPSRPQLPLSKLLQYLYHVACGMDYVASRGIVHRDLAARNVLVTGNGTCKVADFGLARSVGDAQMDAAYEQKSRGAMPIRWMAPESLYMALFSTKSDVWSLGVLTWEIVTLGSTPYPGMSVTEVMSAVKMSYRMERPSHCEDSAYDLMKSCWRCDPNERPSFAELKKTISNLLTKEKGYVDLNLFRDNQYYNVVTESPGEKV